MDPLSALGLAAAVVQFVDFSSKLLIEGYGAYKSVEGATEENIKVQEMVDDLEAICKKLSTTPPANVKLSQAEVNLEKQAGKCISISRELTKLLYELKITSTGGVERSWETVRKMIKSLAKKGKIEKLQKELGAIRQELNTKLLSIIRDSQSSAMVELARITAKQQSMHVENGVRLDQLEQALVQAIQQHVHITPMLD